LFIWFYVLLLTTEIEREKDTHANRAYLKQQRLCWLLKK
jgi:hypothetical protein